jgi:transposase InsO family protein
MSQKLEFVEKASMPGANVAALCREYEISRQTGHKWLRRYREQGYLGLVEQSRRPVSSPLATGEEIVVSILELKGRHPSFGPQKISLVLARRLGPSAPSRTTVARVLRRLGQVKRRRTPVRIWSVEGRPRVEVKAPNDLWTIDFKGWWRARNGEKCEPLTVRDAFSRKVLAVVLVASTHAVHVRRVLERLFRRFGLPLAMQSDNGAPFISTRARGGLTQLSAWLVSLGIRLVRSRPGSPQDNGGHERMHRDLSELQITPASSRRTQQRQCDRWLVDFNHVRPHDALGGKTPAEIYRNSPRRFPPSRIPSYPPEWLTRRVSGMGNVCVNGDIVFISSALAHEIVGLKQETELHWRVRFCEVDLGLVEILPITDAFCSDSVIKTVNIIHGQNAIRNHSPVSP